MSRNRLVLTLAGAAFAAAPVATALHAQTRMLRSPTVSDSKIAFAYANNVWVVDKSGGNARRLTSGPGGASNPKFSPDGKLIAFSADYGGNTDVYVVPADGGEPKRLTWHPGADNVQGWTPDGKNIVFASSRASQAPSAVPRFWTVPLEGGVETPMALPRAYQGKISPDGKFIAYRMNNSWDEERRNYRGGQNRPIWIVDLKTFDLDSTPNMASDLVVAQAGSPRSSAHFTATKTPESKNMDPVWVNNNVIDFISDRDGVANVWSYDKSSKKLTQVTNFSDYDTKTLDAAFDGSSVVFEQAGYIHLLDPKTGKEHIVNITATGDFPWMMGQWKDVTANLANMALSPTGKRVAVEARGEIFTIPATEGDVRDITNSSGSAEREPAWSPDGKQLSYFSDKSGEYELYIVDQDGLTTPREIKIPTTGHFYTASWSPDGKKIMFHDTNLHLWVVDVATGQAKIVGNDPWMVPTRTMDPVWSPDSKWIAYAKHLNSLYKAIEVVNVETGQSKQVTDGLADVMSPAWDASGKYLWFIASTDFGLKSQWLDMTSVDHTETFGLYAAVLRKTDPSPFLPESDEETGMPAAPAFGGGRGGRGGGAAAPDEAAGGADQAPPRAPRVAPTVTIDFDGLSHRILAVPGIPDRQYSSLHAGAPGTVFFLEAGAAGGGRGAGGPGGGATLHRYTLRDHRDVAFVNGVAGGYDVSLDGHKLVYRAGGAGGGRGGRGGAAGAGNGPQLFVVDADRNPPTAGQGRVNDDLRAFIDPKAEFKQMFDEDWRNQRDYLYVPNEHGSDWPKMKQMYGVLLPFVNSREDLNYLMDQMGAEIAIGHSFVRGGDMPQVGTVAPGGLLGADFAIDNGRYKITRIYDDEEWNPDLRAPLAAPGVDVRVGDYILSINGQDLKAPDNIYRLLDGTANRQTALVVNSTPTMDGARHVTVVPVANEQTLRSRAWVEDSRRLVDSLSHGQLAYVYLPSTAGPGYTYFNRYYFSQQDRKGAIVDERYNSGGQAADYIIDVLQRDFDGYFNNVAGDRMPFTSPAAGIWGPKVMVINEMAGSGGDLMPYMFKYRKVGTLVGERTWGGLVHTADTPPFIDGGSAIAPRGGFFARDGKWAVENEGTPPDVTVENTPKEVIAGHDPQLERAVAVALQQLKDHPVERMTKEPAPAEWGKRIKPLP
ncbi:MAG TPA: PDZ domain-containing protein [Gemmatimonadaceae bacterium]|nr:PDZ domain-containing protein [Gemmatimonadaceae bacterium]